MMPYCIAVCVAAIILALSIAYAVLVSMEGRVDSIPQSHRFGALVSDRMQNGEWHE